MRLGVTTLRGSNPRSSAARRPSPGTCRDRACLTGQPKVAIRVAVALIPGPTAPRSSARSRPSSGAWPRGCSAQLSSPSCGQAPPGRRGCARPARSAASRRYAGRHQGAAAARRSLPGVSAALCRPVNLIRPARRTPGQARLGSRSWTFDWPNTLTCGFTSQVDEMRPDPEHRRPGPSIANDRHHQLPANMRLAPVLGSRATHGDTLVMRSSLDDEEDQGAEVPASCATPDDVPAACSIGRSTAETYGHSRTP